MGLLPAHVFMCVARTPELRVRVTRVQVRLVRSRGGNTMECESAEGSVSLYWLPSKFSKVVWAQRGDFLIVGMCLTVEGCVYMACALDATRSARAGCT